VDLSCGQASTTALVSIHNLQIKTTVITFLKKVLLFVPRSEKYRKISTHL
jgi:hypothetical protein